MEVATIDQILRENYVDGVFHSHVSMIQPKGKFNFTREKLEKFWDVYCNNINTDKDIIVGVAEKPQHYLPVLVDIDIKMRNDEDFIPGEHLYTEEHVLQILQIYQSVLRNIVDGCTDEQLTCVLLEKPIYYIDAGDTQYAKNGWHMHFPYLLLNRVDQEVQLLPRIQNEVQKREIFADLGIEDSSSVIDKAVLNVPWLLYGSRKSEGMEPYRVTKVYNSMCEEVGLEEAFKHYMIFDNQERQIDIRGNVEKYLPRILSITPYGRQCNEIVEGLVSPLKEKIKKKNNKSKALKVSTEEALKMAEQLLPLLADWRAEEHGEWMNVGWILYNIGEGSHQALDLWLNFSARCDEKFDESSCIYHWDRMTKKDKTLGSLHYYAKQDNPELYSQLRKEQLDPLLKDSLNGSHNDIAKVLHHHYGNEFVCASITGKTWFQYKNHHWEEIEEGIYLRERISDEIVEYFTDMGSELFQKISAVQDKAEEAMYGTRFKQVQKMISNLKSAPYKNNIMKEAQEVFYRRDFRDKLDQNPYVICFKNGIYDLKTDNFRPGCPDDLVSKVLPIEYKLYKETDTDVQNVIDFLIKVFPDPEIRKYFLDIYSDIFVGGNNHKKIYMWTGDGDNGKSITQLFFDKMLGELSIKFNTQYFTGKKVSSGNANPELSRAAPPVRLVTMEEPDADEQLNIGELKKLSGGDSFWARDLFEKGKSTREVIPMFMFTFITNKLPKLKHSDKATWNRIRVLPYESTFVEPGQPCPETFEEQIQQKRFPMDKDFKNKVPGMVTAFAWYLLQHRKKVSILIEPEKVKEATAIYRRQNDLYRQFIEELVVEDKNSTVSLSEIYGNFKDWFKEGWPNMSLPIKNDVKEYFEKLWGETEKGVKWSGYRIKNMQDETVVLGSEDLVQYDNTNNSGPPM